MCGVRLYARVSFLWLWVVNNVHHAFFFSNNSVCFYSVSINLATSFLMQRLLVVYWLNITQEDMSFSLANPSELTNRSLRIL